MFAQVLRKLFTLVLYEGVKTVFPLLFEGLFHDVVVWCKYKQKENPRSRRFNFAVVAILLAQR